MRFSHVVAAFVGVVGAAWLHWKHGVTGNQIGPLLMAGVVCALLWECCLRLAVIVRRLLGRQGRH